MGSAGGRAAQAGVRRTARPTTGLSRTARQHAARTRRNRLVLVVAVLASAGIVGAWFPVSTLFHQRQQLTAAAAQLHQLDQQDAALRHQEKQLHTPAPLGRIASEEYGLVARGDEAYQVLPRGGSDRSGASLTASGALSTRAGGSASTVGGQSGSSKLAASAGESGQPPAASFFGRVLQTLEFWR